MSVPTVIGYDSQHNPIYRFDAIPDAAPIGPWLNAADYAQPGDNADGALAVNRALAEAAIRDAAVYLSGGLWSLKTPIAPPDGANNLTIVGDGNATIIQPASDFTGSALIYYGGGAKGIKRLTLRNLFLCGASSTYSNNPACDGIQLNSDAEDTIIDSVQFRYLNGWALQMLGGASGDVGYAVVTNCIARICKAGYNFQSTAPATHRTGGIAVSNCVADNIQAGDCFVFNEITDSVAANLQGYSNTGSSLNILGSAFIWVSNCDFGGTGPAVPCVWVQAGSAHGSDHIFLKGLFCQKGSVGLRTSAAAHTTITDCDVYFNTGHGIQIDDDSRNGSVMLIGCRFDQNNQGNTASQYDINNLSQHGNVIVRDCHFQTAVGSGAGHVAATIASPDFWGGLDVQNCVFSGGSPGLSPAVIHQAIIKNNAGVNPFGSMSAPGIPASGTAKVNDHMTDCMVLVTGGTVTNVAIGGVNTGLTSGWFRVPVNQSITLVYSVAPTWQWYGD